MLGEGQIDNGGVLEQREVKLGSKQIHPNPCINGKICELPLHLYFSFPNLSLKQIHPNPWDFEYTQISLYLFEILQNLS